MSLLLRFFSVAFISIFLTVASLAQPGTIDPTFNSSDQGFGFGDGANFVVNATALQADGKILIGGTFTSYNGANRGMFARLNADGSLDQTFNHGTGIASGAVLAIAIQTDGKIIIVGNFGNYSGTAANCIVRLNSDGTIDGSFNPAGVGVNIGFTGGNATLQSLALQSDGKVLIGGNFTQYNGAERRGIARLNTDGTLDADFNSIGTGTNGVVQTIAVQSDGNIVIGGNFTSYNGTSRSMIARLNANGTLDASFDPGTGANATINTLALQSDGKILIGGNFTSYNGSLRNRIIRINADATLDATFDPGTGAMSQQIRSIVTQSDGKLLIGGNFTSYNGTTRNRIARLNTNGTLDAIFNPGTAANNDIQTLSIQSDGKVLIGGSFTLYNGSVRNRLTRLNADGTIDLTFNPGNGSNNTILALALQPNDGKILIGGQFTSYNNQTITKIARLESDGILDATFQPGTGATGGNANINAIAVQTDGHILIGGDFGSYNGTSRNRIARLNTNGTIDGTFNPGTGTSGTNNAVRTIAVQSDGKILIGGIFTGYNGTTSLTSIARLNSDGTIDNTFTPVSLGTNPIINVLVVLSDGKILVGGNFNFLLSGTARKMIVRLNSNGSFDYTFNPAGSGADNEVRAIAVQSDGKILIGGNFTTFNYYNGMTTVTTTRNRIARLNADGTLDETFNPANGTDAVVNAIAIQSGGKILIGGDFTSYNGTTRNRMAQLNADGTLNGLNNTGANGSINAIVLQNDGKPLIGGGFTAYNGTGRNRVARLLINDLSVTVTGNSSACQNSGTVTLTANPTEGLAPYTYSWSNGLGSGATASVSTTSTGTTAVTVTVTDANNISVTSSAFNVTVTASPLAPSAPAAQGSCATTNQNFTFSNIAAGSPGDQIEWATNESFTGSTIVSSPATINVNNVAPGSLSTIYIRSRVSSSGCVSSPVSTSATVTLENTWLGGTGNWTDPTKWSCGNVPSSTQNVIINNGTPTLNTNFTSSGNITLSGTGGLIIAPRQILTISGTTNFGGRPVTISSDTTGSGAIGQITGTLTGATNVTVERFIPASRSWRSLTAPLTGSSNNSVFYNWQNNGVVNGAGAIIWNKTAGPGLATGGVGASMLRYDSENNNWIEVTNTLTEPLFTNTQNNSFLIFVSGPYNTLGTYISNDAASTTLRATGTLRQGTIDFNLTGPDKKRLAMIGNPYASSVLFETVSDNSTGIEDRYWVWDPGPKNSNGAYKLFEKNVGWIGGGRGDFGNSGVIPSGQAIFVRFRSTGLVRFTESSKSTNVSNTGFRLSATDPRININLNQIVNNTAEPRDAVAMLFVPNANAGVDDRDAVKLSNFSNNLSLLRNGSNLTLERRPQVTSTDTMHLRMWGMSETNYQLEINPQYFGLQPGMTAVLQDAFLGTERNLSLTEPTSISFNVSSNAASSGNRFRIVLRSNAVTSVNGLNAANTFSLYPNPVAAGGNLQLGFRNANTGKYTIAVYNVLGMQVMQQVVSVNGGSSVQSLSLPSSLSAGTYIVECTDVNGKREKVKFSVY